MSLKRIFVIGTRHSFDNFVSELPDIIEKRQAQAIVRTNNFEYRWANNDQSIIGIEVSDVILLHDGDYELYRLALTRKR